WIRGGVMARWAGQVLLPIRPLSIGAGLVAETATFEWANRTLNTFWAAHPSPLQASRLWSWSGPGGLKEGLLNSFLFFGVMKGTGFLTREENWVVQHSLQSSAVVGTQNIAANIGLLPKSEGSFAERWIEAEAMNLQQG